MAEVLPKGSSLPDAALHCKYAAKIFCYLIISLVRVFAGISSFMQHHCA